MHAPSLLHRCQQGDPSAWRRLVDDYAGLVYAVARAHRLDEPTCDDVAQSVFAALAANIARITDERALPAWLRTTATRESWRVARRLRRGAPSLQDADDAPAPPDADTAAALDRVDEHHRLRQALRDLGGRCEQLLRILFLSGESIDYDRISAVLGLPRGSIGPTRQRCLRKLLALFAPEHAAEGEPSHAPRRAPGPQPANKLHSE